MREPTPHLIRQAGRVAELLDQGYTLRAIGRDLGITGPRVAQIKRELPRLCEYLGRPARLDSLRSQRRSYGDYGFGLCLWQRPLDGICGTLTMRSNRDESTASSDCASWRRKPRASH